MTGIKIKSIFVLSFNNNLKITKMNVRIITTGQIAKVTTTDNEPMNGLVYILEDFNGNPVWNGSARRFDTGQVEEVLPMTKAEFLAMPSNRKTLEKLRREFTLSGNKFFMEATACLNEFLNLPRNVRVVTSGTSTQSIYRQFTEIKAAGYRKDLNLPF